MKPLLSVLAVAALGTSARAEMVTKTISYEAGGTNFKSFLAYDSARSGQGKLPGVLVFPEWWGLNGFSKDKAADLAKLGYVALGVDMYGEGRSTTDVNEAKCLSGQLYGKPLMAERAQLGLDQLLKTGLVDEGKLAAIGFCLGGAVSQSLAYTGAPLQGVVSFHGALLPLPPEAAGKIKPKFLVLHGALDPLVKKEQVEAFITSLNAGNVDYQFNAYSGAMHAFMNPEADKRGMAGVAYNGEVAHRAWTEMQVFFHDVLGWP